MVDEVFFFILLVNENDVRIIVIFGLIILLENMLISLSILIETNHQNILNINLITTYKL